MSKNETIKFLSHRIEAMQGEIDKLSRKQTRGKLILKKQLPKVQYQV